MKDKITIITFTHLWRNAPSTELIEQTFDSIYSKMNIEECQHIINYDFKDTSDRSIEYYENLVALKDKYNPNIEVTRYNTLNTKRSHIYIGLVKRAKTPYILFWEHDFILQKDVPIEDIVKTMDKHDNINYVRFNKRKNQPQTPKRPTHKPIDYWVEEEKDITEIPLLKVCGYGGLPHIERKTWFLKYCKPLMLTIPIRKYNDLTRAVNKDIYNKRERFGFENTHKQLGTYIYGNMNEEQYVISVEEFKSLEAWGSKHPSEEWRKLNEDK